jgi:hypothetical protein
MPLPVFVGRVVGLVTVAIHREERNHTLMRPAPDRATCAARWLNGVYVYGPAVDEASHHRQETLAWQHPIWTSRISGTAQEPANAPA